MLVKIKLLILVFLGLLTLNSCAQTTKNKEKMISKEQYNTISKEVKTYDYNPTYQLKVNTNLCTYEAYVNDILVDFSFTPGRTAGEQNIDIPQYILKSGKQSVRFRVYPKAITKGVLENLVDKNAEFSIRIVHGEYYKMKFADYKEVFRAKLPKGTIDVPYIELKGEFEAVVPYELKGWSNGVDLSKEDPKKLEEEVLEKYKQYRAAFENKDVATLATMIYKREKEIAQAYFFVSGKANSYDNGWEELAQDCNELIEMKPIEDYEMKITGNGKLVNLLKTNAKHKNFSAVSGTTGKKVRFYGLSLYRPSPGAPLEVIR
jgi:hypothetical protein